MGKNFLHIIIGLLMIASARAQSWAVHTGGSWGTGANWSGGSAPNSYTANVTLGNIIATASATIALGGNTYDINSLTFSNTAGSYTVGSSAGDGQLYMGYSSTAAITTSAPKATINSNVNIFSNGINITPNGTSTLTINGSISQTYNSSLNMMGTGTLVLTGSNSFDNGVNIEKGTLIAENNAALGAPGQVYVDSGATLALSGGISETVGTLWLSGSGAGNAGALVNMSGNNSITTTYNFQLQGNTLLTTTSGTLTLNGQMDANGYNLIHQGAGVLNTGFWAGNSTGQLIQNGPGALNLVGSNNVYAGALIVNGGNLNVNLSGGAYMENTAISVNSGGTLLMEGASNQVNNTDAITMNGGVLETSSGSNSFGAMTLTSNSTIDFLAAADTLGFANSSGLMWNGDLTILGWVSSDNLIYGNNASGLTSAQLADISFDFGTYFEGAEILANGDVIPDGNVMPTPEAPVTLAVAAIAAVIAIRELVALRRRKALA